ncbi:hypothetical protein BDZ89DRAFT_1099356 [Hymenopellis radicata]|nr:hypothetical protein BDZ89DRAFT_1099356 [Hymenopellis radicata]
MSTKIFLTGATGSSVDLPVETTLTQSSGYIGGSTFEITALVRSPDKGELLRSLGLKTVFGSNSDHELLITAASAADVVFACADADDLGAATAILAGLKKRFELVGKKPILIHTSGTGVLATESHGMYATDTVYSDLDIPLIETLGIKQPHREVDTTLVSADADGKFVDTYIVLPSTIYGRATGVLVDREIQKTFSDQIPALVRTCLSRSQAGVIGEGINLWPNVEIHEVASLFVLIFTLALAQDGGSTVPAEFQHGRSGFYFGANGEHKMLDISKKIAQEMERYFPGTTSLSTNSRCRADRSKAIGWNPVKTTSDMLSSIEEEVKAFAT